MKFLILPSLFLAALASCATTSDQGTPGHESTQDSGTTKGEEAQANQEDPKDKSKELADLQHKVHVAQLKVSIATLAADGDDVELREKLTHGQRALAAAQANLANFDAVEVPNRTGRAELSLQNSMDSAKEAQEELEQIALMYDDQNLEDMTAEFVIQRGKRRAERAAKYIEFSKLDLHSLTQHQLKQERENLEGAIQKAEEALEALAREAKQNRLNRALKTSEANHALKKAEEALSEAQAKDTSGAEA